MNVTLSNLKSLALASVVVLGSITATSAQTEILNDNRVETATPTMSTDQESRKANRKDRKARLYSELDLTADQEVKMDQLMEAQKEQARAIKNNDDLDRSAKKAELTKLLSEHKTSVQAILTPEQFATYEQVAKKVQKKRKERQGRAD